MKEQIYILRGGETYSAPTLDVLTVQVEQGFATSPDPTNYGSAGDPGNSLIDDFYNEGF